MGAETRYGIREVRPLGGNLPGGREIRILRARNGSPMVELLTASGPGSDIYMDGLDKKLLCHSPPPPRLHDRGPRRGDSRHRVSGPKEVQIAIRASGARGIRVKGNGSWDFQAMLGGPPPPA